MISGGSKYKKGRKEIDCWETGLFGLDRRESPFRAFQGDDCKVITVSSGFRLATSNGSRDGKVFDGL